MRDAMPVAVPTQIAARRCPLRWRALAALGLAALGLLAPAVAQVEITFLPPPMDGTLSMGIYDKKGKLVRVLHREAGEKEFTVGLNGFITRWDGRDDSGRPAPPGTYEARGYAVGSVEVEGIAIHGNDWMLEDEAAPRPVAITALRPRGLDGVEVILQLATGAERIDVIPLPPPRADAAPPALTVQLTGGQVALGRGEETRPFPLGEGESALDAAAGAGDRLWLIVQTAQGVEVRQYAADGEFLRRLGYAPGDPAPKRIVASRGDEQIVLLEENAQLQRVRALLRSDEAPPAQDPAVPAAEPASVWKTVLEKALWRSASFETVKPLLQRPSGKPFAPEKEFVVKLIDNELIKNEPSSARVNIGWNARGSFLQTTDGLPLLRITEAPNLKWAVIDREGSGRQLTILQSDGTAVEEFRASKLANMMMFDAGDYEWDGKAE